MPSNSDINNISYADALKNDNPNKPTYIAQIHNTFNSNVFTKNKEKYGDKLKDRLELIKQSGMTIAESMVSTEQGTAESIQEKY